MAKFDQKERLAQKGGRSRIGCKVCAGSYVAGFYREHARRAHLRPTYHQLKKGKK